MAKSAHRNDVRPGVVAEVGQQEEVQRRADEQAELDVEETGHEGDGHRHQFDAPRAPHGPHLPPTFVPHCQTKQ